MARDKNRGVECAGKLAGWTFMISHFNCHVVSMKITAWKNVSKVAIAQSAL